MYYQNHKGLPTLITWLKQLSMPYYNLEVPKLLQNKEGLVQKKFLTDNIEGYDQD